MIFSILGNRIFRKLSEESVMNKWVKGTALVSTSVILGAALSPLPIEAAKYKTINWIEAAPLGTQDPSMATATVDFDGLTATGEGLYRSNAKGKLALAAAKSVDVSDDKLTYTFHLRDGLKWSNGEAITANDFVYSWRRTVNPETASQYSYLFSGIKNADDIMAGTNKDVNSWGVEAKDDKTLVVTLDRQMPQLKSELAMATFLPQNQAFVEKAGKNYGTSAEYTLSSGPFVLKDWSGSNKKYTLVKNDQYWDAKSVKTNKVTVQAVTSNNTGYNLFKSGDTDLAYLNATQTKAYKSDKNYKVLPMASTNYLEFNEEKVAAFKNEKVRQAISYAIDRNKLAKNVLTGSATAATTFTPAGLAKDPNSGKDFAKSAAAKGAIKYDKSKAAKLWKAGLKEVGVSKLSVELLTDDTDAAKSQAQFIQSELQKLDGLEVSIKQVPFKTRLSDSQNGNFDMVVTKWGADYAEPSTFLDLLTADGSFNNGKWKSETYDKAMAAAKSATSDKARFKEYKTAEQALEKEVGVAPLTYGAYSTLYRTSVKGVVYNSVGTPFDFKYAYKK
jgi:oligopeptide transport system substrate-binding protein